MDDFVVYLDDPHQKRQQVKADQTHTNNSNKQLEATQKNNNNNNKNSGNSGEKAEYKKSNALHNDDNDDDNYGHEEYRLLTREDLNQLDKEEPKWKRIRIGLLIGFWIVWFGLLAAVIIYAFVGPKCPFTPKLPFWKSTIGYWVDVFAFKDTSGDFIGDLNGFISEADYIKNVIGAGYVILGPITKGFYSNKYNVLGLVEDYEELDEAVGTMEDFRRLIKRLQKLGVKVILTFDFNAISHEHKWIVENKVALTKLPEHFGIGYSRYSRQVDVNIKNEKYYSVFGSPSVDLNLTDSNTQKAILDTIGHWMNEGIDGILLDNCAFFNEIMESTQGSSGITTHSWFQSYPIRQLFINTSVDFVGQIKKEIDAWSTKTGKEKLLAVSPGDVGYGLTNETDPMLMYKDVADLIMTREFVPYRGWKINNKWRDLDIQHYFRYTNDDMTKLGLSISNPSEPLNSNLLSLAASFLLPGSPVIYYGTELDVTTLGTDYVPDLFYPKDRFFYENAADNKKTLLAHLPMPWSSNGKRFSEAINDTSFADHLRHYQITDTVESSLAEGRGDTILSLVKSLADLYKYSSLKWSSVEQIPHPPEHSRYIFGLFARKAKDFSTFVVALLKPFMHEQMTLDFTSVCSSVTPRIVYPSRDNLLVNVTLSSAKIFVKENQESAQILVFQCN